MIYIETEDTGGITLQEKIKVVNDWNLNQREEEEMLYSEKEMDNYLLSIEKSKKHLLSCIEEIESTSHVSTQLAKIGCFKRILMKLEVKRLDELKNKAISIFKKDVSYNFKDNQVMYEGTRYSDYMEEEDLEDSDFEL